MLYVAVFPFSSFLTRVYTEALFLVTNGPGISRACDGRWWRAGLWGAAASLTRPNGILISDSARAAGVPRPERVRAPLAGRPPPARCRSPRPLLCVRVHAVGDLLA